MAKRKQIAENLTQKEQRAVVFYNALVTAVQTENKLRSMTNNQLANLLVGNITAKSELIDEVARRLRVLPEPPEVNDTTIPPIESKIVKVHITEIYRPGPVMPPEVE